MDGCDGSGMGFSHDGGHSVINPMSGEVSDMAMSSMPLHTKPSNASDPFFSSGWDPISSLSQNQTYMISNRHIPNYPYPPPIWENQGISSNCTPQLPHYQPESSFVGLPSFVSRGYPEMAGSLGLPECSQIANSGCPPNYGEGTQARAPHSQECRNSEEEATGSPSNERRRKRSPESGDPNKKNEGELGKDPPGDATEVPKEQNEKKQRTEQTESANSRGKQSSKQAKEDSNSGDAPKDNYIHVRARRGQATNSHSLAERVRREKISERMRLLQELVPGCNKITGKAVMLDEIINYVQSLQQQVEFLSMKLSTLIPDLGIDLERALSKEVLQSHSRDAIVRGLGPGTGSSLPFAPGLFQNSLPGVSSTSQYNPLPQAPLDNDLQTLFQMGFDSSSAMDILKNNARLKSEQ